MENKNFGFVFENPFNFSFTPEFLLQSFTNFANFFNCPTEFFKDPTSENLTVPRKRGRKKLRPNNPTKTEVMDKYWLRGFRDFMKGHFCQIQEHLGESRFWDYFLGKTGIPGKKSHFLSYSKAYKQNLFSSKSFCKVFVAWASLYGLAKIPRKNFKGNWECYYEYLWSDLVSNCYSNASAEEVKDCFDVMSAVIQDKEVTGNLIFQQI